MSRVKHPDEPDTVQPVTEEASPHVMLAVQRKDLEELRRKHGRDCEKLDAHVRYRLGHPSDWCSCGADNHNARLDRILGGA
jgi:hypothetical protein